MDLMQILILAVVQGVAELLPVSSSAHVIIAEKMMGLDPTAPQFTFLLVMLHTGTMFAVIVYFWKSWRNTYFLSSRSFRTSALLVLLASAVTGVVGLVLLQVIHGVVASGAPSFEIEHLFGNTRLIAGALAAAGILIVLSSRFDRAGTSEVSVRTSAWIGAVQGLCLPFRGFSRSGATISTGLLLGVSRRRAEEFSFALAVALTPAVIAKEAHRLYASQSAAQLADAGAYLQLAMPSLLGMVFSFLAGLIALRWLSRWLEQGRWHLFGLYCLVLSPLVLWLG